MRIIISLSREEILDLNKPLSGQGGFQSLIAVLQLKLRDTELELNIDDIELIARYVRKYGKGGFQGRLDGVFRAIDQLAHALRNIINNS